MDENGERKVRVEKVEYSSPVRASHGNISIGSVVIRGWQVRECGTSRVLTGTLRRKADALRWVADNDRTLAG